MKRELERSLSRSAGGMLVTITDVANWSGRSREYLRKNILKDLRCIHEGTSRFYYVGHVAQAFADKMH